jgi:hypothetical protein
MIKKIKILILTLLFAVPGIFAQTVEIQKLENQFQGPVTVGLYMKDLANVAAITLTVDYSGMGLLSYVDCSNLLLDNIIVNDSADAKLLKIRYFNAAGVNISDDTFLEMNFYYQGGSIAPVNFFQTNNVEFFEFTDKYLQVINVTPLDGYVSHSSTGYVGKLSVPSTEAFDGANITLPVQIEELVSGGLSAVNSITLEVGYDPAKLEYKGYTLNGYNFVLTGQTPGTIKMNWSNTTAQNMAGPLDLVDLKFKIIGTGESEVEFLPGTTVTSGTVTQNILMESGDVLGANARVKVFLEGYYTGSGQMRKAQQDNGGIVDRFAGTIADEITIELHTPGSYGVNPYVYSGIKLNQDGYAYFAATGLDATNYYVTVKHRNHLETVSATSVNFSLSGVTYNFTTAAGQAFGNNQKALGDGNFAIFAGDVNQDGFVNASDRTLVQTDVISILTGYLNTDVTGNGFVNAQDRTLVQSNVISIIARIVP